MDTELARTFLTVIAAGSFVSAAERLHVTQSTVSARIQVLERALGCRLFVRNKAGTTLTAAGEGFRRHASLLVRTVEQARHDVGLPAGYHARITVGGRFGLWDDLLAHWLAAFRARAPDVSVRAEIGFESELMQGLIEGRLDIGVMYTPQSRPGMTLEKLFEETLVLVTTSPGAPPEPGPGYVYVDWGPEFYARHNASFPAFDGPPLTVNIGWLGLRHILANGGSGYFPARLMRRYLEQGRLHRPPGAPTFALPAYAAHAGDDAQPAVALALETMRSLLSEASGPDVAAARDGRRR